MASLPSCECGCGGNTKGGHYLPGHDQKLRVAIEKEAGGLREVKHIVEKALGIQITVKE